MRGLKKWRKLVAPAERDLLHRGVGDVLAGVCNDLWLQLMTVSLCDGLIRRMYVERERENSAHERGRA